MTYLCIAAALGLCIGWWGMSIAIAATIGRKDRQ